MSLRKVQQVMPISAMAPSRLVEINRTSSILTADGRAGGDRRHLREKHAHQGCPRPRGRGSSHSGPHDLDSSEMSVGKLSGEGDRIGRPEWNENPL